jgi:hypothetical protein
MVSTLTDNRCRACGGSTAADISTHEATPDPHPGYLLEVDAAATYATAAAIATAVSDHEALANPHPVYLTQAEGDAAYEPLGGGGASVAAHVADAGDPHAAAGYTKTTFVEDRTGWGYYQNDTETSGAPLVLVAATPADLPNPADTTNENELPSDRTDFYETTGDTVTFGSVDELVEIEVQLTVEAVAATDWLDIWLEESGGTEHGRTTFALPKGTTPQTLVHRFAVAASALLVANGGTVRVESNDAVSVYDIRYLISRSHFTRTT